MKHLSIVNIGFFELVTNLLATLTPSVNVHILTINPEQLFFVSFKKGLFYELKKGLFWNVKLIQHADIKIFSKFFGLSWSVVIGMKIKQCNNC
jgi:hypothetical protein